MRTTDLSPFYRSSVGFDRLFNLLDSATSEASNQSYPPYNIEKTGEDTYRITVAVAGFSDDELEVESHNNALRVSGKKAGKDEKTEFLHRGIATRNFERRFELAEHVEVAGAVIENGLLNINLVREVPEALKPKLINIASNNRRPHTIAAE
jgi:molecular chaperone IbpA